MKKIILGALAGLLLSSAAAAEDVTVSVDVLTEVEIKDRNGDPILERKPLEVASPNQTVIYRITVENSGKTKAEDIVLNIPISKSLVIKPNTFVSDIKMKASFSIDGKTFYPFSDLKVAEGETVRAAAQEDIKTVRIDIPEVPRQESFFVEYDAIIQ